MGSETKKVLSLMETESAMISCASTIITVVEVDLENPHNRTFNHCELFLMRRKICIDYFKPDQTDETKKHLMELFIRYNRQIAKALRIIF